MKTIMAVLVAFLAFPALASEYDGDGPDCCPTCHLYLEKCAAIKALYDAWYAKGSSQRYFESRMTYKECRVGGKENAPERTDPNFLAWKELFRQYLILDEFTRIHGWGKNDFPNEYKAVHDACLGWRIGDHITQWAKDHVAPDYAGCGSHQSRISRPPPEMYGTDRVKAGRSVDEAGHLDPSGGGGMDFLKYLVFPFILSVVVCLYFQGKGQNGPFFGVCSIALYAWLTDPWMVAGHFLGAYMLVAYFVIFAFVGGAKLVMAVARK